MPAPKLLGRLKAACFGQKPPLTDEQRAQALIAAIDAGGIPLNAARVNAIARSLGLEVSTKAPVNDTLARIRQALQRQMPPAVPPL
jgi:hypothetical protein